MKENMALYTPPTFVNVPQGTEPPSGAPPLSADNLNNLAQCAAKNQSYPISLTVKASDWTGTPPTNVITSTTVSSLALVTATTVGYCKLSESATDTQKKQAVIYNVRMSAQGNGTITFACSGTKPTVDLPFTLIIVSDGTLAP